jgi:hypothetical protein
VSGGSGFLHYGIKTPHNRLAINRGSLRAGGEKSRSLSALVMLQGDKTGGYTKGWHRWGG